MRMSSINTFEKSAVLIKKFCDGGEEPWLLKGDKLKKVASGATVTCYLIRQLGCFKSNIKRSFFMKGGNAVE